MEAPFRISPRPGPRLALFFFVLAIISAHAALSGAAAPDDAFATLKQRLIRDGVPADRVSMLYPPDASPLLKSVSSMFYIKESKLNYGRFLEPSSVALARKLLRKYESHLVRAENAYGVDRSVIAAILFVETGFGQNTGSTSALNVFSTFALMEDKNCRDGIWSTLPYELREEWGSYLFDQRLIKRAQWAYAELRALIEWTGAEPETARSLRGSYMGAIGWPQFLPTSILRFGVDADNRGRVDLFNPSDAIMSVGNYLRSFGWREGASRTEQEQVIFHYNHSTPYVNTILDLAAMLRNG